MASTMSDFADEVSEAGKNLLTVVCIYCDTVIMNPSIGLHTSSPHSLPTPTQRKDAPQTQVEEVVEWWQVDDMFAFENIGFSNTVDETKFLVCANCDRGPVGYHHIPTKRNFVALCRVKHIHLPEGGEQQ